jgi:hypothetical protein
MWQTWLSKIINLKTQPKIFQSWLSTKPWFIAAVIFTILLILSLIFFACLGLKANELATILLSVATLETLIVTAIYIFKYWKETQRTNELSFKNMAYNKLPIFDFKVKVHYQSPDRIYYDEQISIVNKGYGPAFNVTLWKSPLPGNTQKRIVYGGNKTEINGHRDKKYNIISPGESFYFYHEDGHPAKEIKIKVLFRDMFNQRFEWEYTGAPQQLRLSRWHIDPAEKSAQKSGGLAIEPKIS